MVMTGQMIDLARKQCPKALDYFADDDIEIHVFEFVAKTLAADIVTGQVEEEDLPRLDETFEIRRLAKAWLEKNPPSAYSEHEELVSIDRDGRITDSDPKNDDAWYGDMLDTISMMQGTETGERILQVDTYTLDLEADHGVLLNVRYMAKALLAEQWALNLGIEYDGIRLRLINLRTGRDASAIIGLDRHRDNILSDLRIVVDWLAEDRRARPGVGCIGCPYTVVCEAHQAFLKDRPDYGSLDALATRYAVLTAARDALEPLVRKACANASIATDRGKIGFKTVPSLETHDRTNELIVRQFFCLLDNDQWERLHRPMHANYIALLDLLEIKAANVEAYADRIRNREAFVEQALDEVDNVEFGIWKDE